MEVKPPEEKSLVLVKGRRPDHILQSGPPEAAKLPITTAIASSALLATEWRLALVGRPLRWRLRPADVLCAVAIGLGRLVATAAQGDRALLNQQVENVCRQVRAASEEAFELGEAP